MNQDPEYLRYRKKYSKFPGVETCVKLLRQRNVQGAFLDAVIGDLIKHAPETIWEITAALQQEDDARVRVLLLSVIAEVGVPDSVNVLKDYLQAEDESLRHGRKQDLKKLEQSKPEGTFGKPRATETVAACRTPVTDYR